MTAQPQTIPAVQVPAKLRIGSVAYLNSRPLNDAIAGEVKLETPASLARDMEAGELDVALLPVMAILSNPVYTLVDGIGICCQGPVHSVILSHQKPIKEIGTIAVDDASRTSVALLRVLVQDFLKRPEIKFVDHDDTADAHLWIGDRAITRRHEHPEEHHLDLGAAWWQWQRLPFVFAVWAMRAEVASPEVADALRTAAAKGMPRRAEIARNDEEYKYLTQQIRYQVGTDEKRGLATFAECLRNRGVLPETPQLTWI